MKTFCKAAVLLISMSQWISCMINDEYECDLNSLAMDLGIYLQLMSLRVYYRKEHSLKKLVQSFYPDKNDIPPNITSIPSDILNSWKEEAIIYEFTGRILAELGCSMTEVLGHNIGCQAFNRKEPITVPLNAHPKGLLIAKFVRDNLALFEQHRGHPYQIPGFAEVQKQFYAIQDPFRSWCAECSEKGILRLPAIAED